MTNPRGRLALMAAIFVVAFIMRAALIGTFDRADIGFSDALYVQYAQHLHEGSGFWADGPYGTAGPEKVYAYRPPLFPLVWGMLYGVTRGGYAPMWYGFALLSSIGCVLVFRVGLRLFGRDDAAAVGAFLCAIYPPLVFHGVSLMTEPFFIFFGVLAVLFLLRLWDDGRAIDAVIAGIALGLATLSRSVMIGFAPIILVWLLFKRGRRWRCALIFGAAFAVTLAPWVIRNAIVLRSFVVTTTDGGHGLYAANNPLARDDPRGFHIPRDWSFMLREGETSVNEVEASRRLTLKGLEELRAEDVLRRAIGFWRPFPHGEFVGHRNVVIYALSFIPLVPFILVGLVLAHRRLGLGKLLLIDLLILYTWAIHSLILVMVRYREPLMPFLLLFAGFALVALVRRPAAQSANAGDHFDLIADRYDASLPAHVTEHYLRKRLRMLRREFSDARAVLDVGCGTGRLLAAFGRESGTCVIGADLSRGMLAKAPEGEVVRASSTMLPFADNSFDGAYSVALLHHLRAPESVAATLREMVRVTRPGGRVIVWDHNPANPYWPVIMAKVPQDTGDERLVPAKEITAALRAAGATDVRVMKSGFVPEFVPRALMPLAAAVEWIVERTPLIRRLTAHNVILARKS